MQMLSAQSLDDVHGLARSAGSRARPRITSLSADRSTLRHGQPATGPSWIVRVLGFLAAPWLALAKARRNRLAILDVSRLDDRMLSDIGISRAEIEAAVNGASIRGRSS